MRKCGYAIALLACASPLLFPLAFAQQGVYVPPQDPSNLVTKSELGAVQSLIPKPATTAPAMETPVGWVGTAGTYRPGDAVQPRITRSKTLTLDGTGQATFDWTDQGALGTPVQVVTTAIYTGTGVPKCWVTATSATAVKVKCVVENNTLLNLAAVTAGINLNGGSASGMSVSVVVLPPS